MFFNRSAFILSFKNGFSISSITIMMIANARSNPP